MGRNKSKSNSQEGVVTEEVMTPPVEEKVIEEVTEEVLEGTVETVSFVTNTNIKHNGVFIPCGTKYTGDNIQEFLELGVIDPVD